LDYSKLRRKAYQSRKAEVLIRHRLLVNSTAKPLPQRDSNKNQEETGGLNI
jgi:hypothetical protein